MSEKDERHSYSPTRDPNYDPNYNPHKKEVNRLQKAYNKVTRQFYGFLGGVGGLAVLVGLGIFLTKEGCFDKKSPSSGLTNQFNTTLTLEDGGENVPRHDNKPTGLDYIMK